MRPPSLVARPYTSSTLPLLRFTSTYHALGSTVAADAGTAVTAVTVPAARSTAATVAVTGRRRRVRGGSGASTLAFIEHSFGSRQGPPLVGAAVAAPDDQLG